MQNIEFANTDDVITNEMEKNERFKFNNNFILNDLL